MSDDADESLGGPVMLAATNMLKPPPAVIGSLNKEVTLPRTIKLTTLVAVAIGAVFGFVIALLVAGAGADALIWGPSLGGAVGWAAVNFSPLRGESLAMWLGLQANSARKRRLVVEGKPVRLYVGIAPLRRTAAGKVRMLPGGVPVNAAHWDSRGVPQQEMPGHERLAGHPQRPVAAGDRGTRPRRVARGRRPRRLTASTRLSSQSAPVRRR